MQIAISGQNCSIESHLQEHIHDHLNKKIQKYLNYAVSATVNFSFSQHTNIYTCNLSINAGTTKGFFPASEANSKDVYYSFDLAVIKLEQQLRKYKNKLKDNKHKISYTTAIKYVIGSDIEEEQEENDNPIIIAEKPIDILTLSVKDAVMKLDLENLPALLFQNARNSKINMVYYRKDGNIAWVDCK